ncbi:transposase [Streptomyces fagopyri]|uniref:transposase n=1 Tax=Streptomyces fagopyri TaxID=2662397 RepID=UPI0037F5BB51
MTSENETGPKSACLTEAVSASIADNQLIDELAHRARPEGPQLTGKGGQPRLLESTLARQHWPRGSIGPEG